MGGLTLERTRLPERPRRTFAVLVDGIEEVCVEGVEGERLSWWVLGVLGKPGFVSFGIRYRKKRDGNGSGGREHKERER